LRPLLAISLLLNVALLAWLGTGAAKFYATDGPYKLRYRAVSDRLGTSQMHQARGLRNQVELRDSLAARAGGDPAWLQSEERRDMLARATELDAESRLAQFEAGTRSGSDLGPPGDSAR